MNVALEYVVLEHPTIGIIKRKRNTPLIVEVKGDIEQVMIDCIEYPDNKLKDIVVEWQMS